MPIRPTAHFLASGVQTYRIHNNAAADPKSEWLQCRKLPRVEIEDDIEYTTGITPAVGRRLPPEVVSMILFELVESCVRSRDFALACEYVCMRRDTLLRWHGAMFGGSEVDLAKGSAHRRRISIYSDFVRLANDVAGWFFMLHVIDEAWDQELFREHEPMVASMVTYSKRCRHHLKSPRGVVPGDFAERRVCKEDGTVERLAYMGIEEEPADRVVIWHFESPEKTGVVTWRGGTRVCDAQLHDGRMQEDGRVAAIEENGLFPYILLRLGGRSNGRCDCTDRPHVGRGWLTNAHVWTVFAEHVAKAFLGAQLLLYVPWHVVDMAVNERPIDASGQFIRPRDVCKI